MNKVTSKNIEQFQEAINLQQTYTTSLCSHVNAIYVKLAQLENQIQTPCLYPHSQTDSVQIIVPEYNPDIDSQIDTLPELQSHAKNNQEEPTSATGDSEDIHLPRDTNGTDPQSESVQNPAEYPLHQKAESFFEQHQDKQRPQLEDISELEDEDWEDGQFANADLIDHHKTKKESNGI